MMRAVLVASGLLLARATTVGDLYKKDWLKDTEGDQFVSEGDQSGKPCTDDSCRGKGHDVVQADLQETVYYDNNPPPPTVQHKHRDNIIYDVCDRFRQVRGADFIFVFDASMSVSKHQWDIYKQFALTLMKHARHPDSRIAVIRAADVVTVDYDFNDDPDEVEAGIMDLVRDAKTGGTMINSALWTAIQMYMDPTFQAIGNARGIMLMTDGIPAVSGRVSKKKDAKLISENPCDFAKNPYTLQLLNVNLINMLTISVGLHKNERRLTKCLWDPVKIGDSVLSNIRRYEIGIPYIEDIQPLIDEPECFSKAQDADVCAKYTTQRKCNKSYHSCRWQIKRRGSRPRWNDKSDVASDVPCVSAQVPKTDCQAPEKQNIDECDKRNDDNQCTWFGTYCNKNPFGAVAVFGEVRRYDEQTCLDAGFRFITDPNNIPDDIQELLDLMSFAFNTDNEFCSQFTDAATCAAFRCRYSVVNGQPSCAASVAYGCLPPLPWKMKCRSFKNAPDLCDRIPGCKYKAPEDSPKYKVKERGLACYGNIFPQGIGSTGNT